MPNEDELNKTESGAENHGKYPLEERTCEKEINLEKIKDDFMVNLLLSKIHNKKNKGGKKKRGSEKPSD